MNEVGTLEDYRFSNNKLLTFSNLVPGKVIKVAQDWRLGKGGLFWDCSYIMTRLLLDHLESEESKQDDANESKVLVELGASTMLPCMAAAFKYPEKLKCFATDVKKVMPLTQKCHDLNEKPGNIVPLELYWGEASHYERLQEALEGKPIDYIICSDLVYDQDLFPDLLDSLKFLSQVNLSADGQEQRSAPQILFSLKKRDPALS